MLAHPDRRSTRTDRHGLGQHFQERHGNVLDLRRDHVAHLGEAPVGAGVVVGPHDLLGRHVGRRTAGCVVGADHDPVAGRRRLDGEESAQLTTAEDADRGPGRNDRGRRAGRSDCEATAASCAAVRRPASREANATSAMASTAAAKRAAFTDPARPMANVVTGTPAGICTIERSESMPSNTDDGPGTPSTGTSVCAASFPGRWAAAPPALAKITRRPREEADVAYDDISCGILCALTIFVSWAMPSSSSTIDACSITDQSEVEPMTMPTSGAVIQPRACSSALPWRSARRAGDFRLGPQP